MIISDRMVLESNAGFYIGRTQNGFPYDRQSIYYYSKWEANLLIGNVNQEEAAQEIEQELPRAKRLKSSLGKKRVAFLLHALKSFKTSKIPIERWDYNA